MVGMCRPLIREPNLIKRWQQDDLKETECIHCNKCVFALGKGMPLACYVNEKISMKVKTVIFTIKNAIPVF
jgi:2,4-dienoyl-CoA reductase-like NADH-dependent reductase (Old Yellow Enzyme family)